MADDLYRTALAYLLGAVLLAAGLGYCAGNAHGRRSAKLEQNTHRIQVATTRRKEAEAVSKRAIENSFKAREERRAVRARIEITTDSTIRVDGGPELPRTIPEVSLLRSSDTQARTDSVTIIALQRQITALEEDRDAYKERVALLTPARCSFKCGAAIGATGATIVILAIAFLVF